MLMSKRSNGFTIVELLIVIVVIGILAAIVIVAYTGVTNSANESAVKSDMANFAKKVEQFKVLSASGNYPFSATELDTMQFKFNKNSLITSRNNLYYYRSESGTRYALGAIAKNGSAYFLVDGSIEQVAVDGVNATTTRAKVDVVGVDDNSDGTVDNIGSSGGYGNTVTPPWANWT